MRLSKHVCKTYDYRPGRGILAILFKDVGYATSQMRIGFWHQERIDELSINIMSYGVTVFDGEAKSISIYRIYIPNNKLLVVLIDSGVRWEKLS